MTLSLRREGHFVFVHYGRFGQDITPPSDDGTDYGLTSRMLQEFVHSVSVALSFLTSSILRWRLYPSTTLRYLHDNHGISFSEGKYHLMGTMPAIVLCHSVSLKLWAETLLFSSLLILVPLSGTFTFTITKAGIPFVRRETNERTECRLGGWRIIHAG
jgi:hypothetical protein